MILNKKCVKDTCVYVRVCEGGGGGVVDFDSLESSQAYRFLAS